MVLFYMVDFVHRQFYQLMVLVECFYFQLLLSFFYKSIKLIIKYNFPSWHILQFSDSNYQLIFRNCISMSDMYIWGKSIIPEQPESTTKSINKLQIQQQVVDISCGMEHSIVLTKNKLYFMGNNKNGQAGLDKKSFDNLPLIEIPFSCKVNIQAVSCGWYHTLILDVEGQVYSSGIGQDGALGYGDGDSSYSFKPVMKGAKKISAGKDHSLALTNTKVFGWGNCKDGQLGLLNKRIYYSPKQLNIYPCSTIFAGAKYSIFVTSKGVYATGLNHNAQLGLGHENNVFTPKRLNIEDSVKKIVGSNYCIAITQNNQGYMWGTGILGKFLYPTKMNFLQSIQTACIGNTYGLLQTSNKQIFVWGTNRNGELHLYDKNGCEFVTQNSFLSELQLDDIFCGGNYVIGLKRSYNSNSMKNVENNKDDLSSFYEGGVQQQFSKSKMHRNHGYPYHDQIYEQSFPTTLKDFCKNKSLGSNFYKTQQLSSPSIMNYSKIQQLTNNKLNSTQILKDENSKLKQQLELKNRYILKLREQYLNMVDFIESNRFMNGLMGNSATKFTSDKMKIYEQGAQYEAQDNFSKKLSILKELLQNTNNF